MELYNSLVSLHWNQGNIWTKVTDTIFVGDAPVIATSVRVRELRPDGENARYASYIFCNRLISFTTVKIDLFISTLVQTLSILFYQSDQEFLLPAQILITIPPVVHICKVRRRLFFLLLYLRGLSQIF